MDDLENSFAARVFTAEREAGIARKHGLGASSSDFIECALCELWERAPESAQSIADRYIYWDVSGRPHRRKLPEKVVVIR